MDDAERGGWRSDLHHLTSVFCLGREIFFCCFFACPSVRLKTGSDRVRDGLCWWCLLACFLCLGRDIKVADRWADGWMRSTSLTTVVSLVCASCAPTASKRHQGWLLHFLADHSCVDAKLTFGMSFSFLDPTVWPRHFGGWTVVNEVSTTTSSARAIMTSVRWRRQADRRAYRSSG
ncbi:hypothetical protein IWZ01DRAFT_160115 [Phyllosticta capitalensis]